MMVIYAYDPNTIFVDPLQDRTNYSILQDYRNITGHLTKRGFKPRLKNLDNEASQLI